MILMIVMVGVERVIGLSVGRGGGAECGSTTKCGPCYIPGMFRFLLICLMLFTGSAHAAEDDFDAVKKAAELGHVDAQYTLVACTPEAIS